VSLARMLRTSSPLALIALAGCVGPMMGATTAKDVGERPAYQAKAEAGNAEAQFKLGDSWCCSVGNHQGLIRKNVYDNQTATEWLCKAARQGYGLAQVELARIYSGRPFRYNAMKKLANRVLGAPTNMASALMWANLAAQNHVEAAAELQTALLSESSLDDQAEAKRLASNWRSAPCTWLETIGAS
jgi:TPR repeat protein